MTEVNILNVRKNHKNAHSCKKEVINFYFEILGLTFNEKIDPLSAHLFTLGGWRWRALRMKLSPTFTSGKMKMMYGVMAECAEKLEKMLEESAKNEEILEIKGKRLFNRFLTDGKTNPVIHFFPYKFSEPLAKFTTDIIGTCAFGLQLNAMSDDESEFRKMGRRIFTPSKLANIKRSVATAIPFLTRYIRLSILPKHVSIILLKKIYTLNFFL